MTPAPGQAPEADISVLRLLPEPLAKRCRIFPTGLDPFGRLLLAMENPMDFELVNELQASLGLDIIPVAATHQELDHWIRSRYRGTSASAPASHDRGNPVVRMVDDIIASTIQSGASDIHIEPYERETVVRIRIDGQLREIKRVSRRLSLELVSRIKIMASLDIAERRRPQDGAIRYASGGRSFDIRVSAIPTEHGQKLVLRILDRSGAELDMDSLELGEHNRRLLDTCIERPHGMVLVTGPTGSGKTTTLYSLVKSLRSPSLNISTIEDPIEYRMDGITQTAVNPKIGLDFATCLRTLLRQDPDVILVGEIRDHETAELAIRAALTGHLVLSTLHTNDAPTAIARLTDMGIEPFLIVSSLQLVVAQRLVRRRCPECGGRLSTKCGLCGGSGYFGRIGLFECMPVDTTLREAIHARATTEQLRTIATAAGMRTLLEDGLVKASNGLTTESEVKREASAP
jgi:type II secretory ATPase GspE/PulE/Tfp pilus assembly ATPase PilB-like protein